MTQSAITAHGRSPPPLQSQEAARNVSQDRALRRFPRLLRWREIPGQHSSESAIKSVPSSSDTHSQ